MKFTRNTFRLAREPPVKETEPFFTSEYAIMPKIIRNSL